MKKAAMLSLLLAVMLSAAILSVPVLAASVSRSMPSRVAPGDGFAVAFSVSGVKGGEIFTLEDQAPAGWQVASWDVAGARGGKGEVDYRYVADGSRHGFSYVSEGSSSQITLNVNVPASASLGSYSFDAVFFDSSGQGRSSGSVTVRRVACGDGVCEGSESAQTCVADCPAPVVAPPPAPAAGGENDEAVLVEVKKPGVGSSVILVALVVFGVAAAWLFLKSRKKVMR